MSSHPVDTSFAIPLRAPLPIALARTARLVHPSKEVGDVFDRIKYFLRGMAQGRSTSSWFKALNIPECTRLIALHPHILSKLQRPYLHRQLNGTAKLEALEAHYRFVSDNLDAQVMAAAADWQGFPVAMLNLGEGGIFSLCLYYHSRFEKEGELCIGLRDEAAKQFLFTLTFCVNQYREDHSGDIFVGGLQGHRFEGSHERIIAMTRQMHGLRPKALLLFTLQRLAQLWRMKTITAVGDSEHIYQHAKKLRELNASYDELWLESDGVRNADGNFSLPTTPQTRDVAELTASKRAMYRKRYAFLGRLGEEMRNQLDSPAAIPTPVLAKEPAKPGATIPPVEAQ